MEKPLASLAEVRTALKKHSAPPVMIADKAYYPFITAANIPAQPLVPLSEAELERLRQQLPPAASQAELDLITARKHARAKEQQAIEKGRALWPDISAQQQPDISDITRTIARSS